MIYIEYTYIYKNVIICIVYIYSLIICIFVEIYNTYKDIKKGRKQITTAISFMLYECIRSRNCGKIVSTTVVQIRSKMSPPGQFPVEKVNFKYLKVRLADVQHRSLNRIYIEIYQKKTCQFPNLDYFWTTTKNIYSTLWKSGAQEEKIWGESFYYLAGRHQIRSAIVSFNCLRTRENLHTYSTFVW